MRSNRRLPLVLLGCVLAVVALFLAAAWLIESDQPEDAPTAVSIDGPDRDRARDDNLPLGDRAQQVLGSVDDAHPDVADFPGVLRGEDDQPAGVLPEGGGSQEFPGCRTRFVGSYSARTRSVKAIGLHYTAGPNQPGYADMDGLTAYSSRNQVSWHFLIDREGHCYYSVPLTGKAWTIGNLNSETTNIEVVGRGNEADYGGTAGVAKLSRVVREIGRRQGIPIQMGATDGRCNITRKGIITHWMGGGCSGGHSDIRPYVLQKVIVKIRGGGGPTSRLTKVERQVAAKRCYHRAEHLASRKRAENLKWARFYKARILYPPRRFFPVGGETQLITAIDNAKRKDGKPWRYRYRGPRRATLAGDYSGKGC